MWYCLCFSKVRRRYFFVLDCDGVFVLWELLFGVECVEINDIEVLKFILLKKCSF